MRKFPNLTFCEKICEILHIEEVENGSFVEEKCQLAEICMFNKVAANFQ